MGTNQGIDTKPVQRGEISGADGGYIVIHFPKSNTCGYLSPRDAEAILADNSITVGTSLDFRAIAPREDGVRVLLANDPFVNAIDKHPVGSTLERSVTRVVDFGVFVDVEPGIPGLVHVAHCPGRTTDGFKAGLNVKIQITEVSLPGRGFRVKFVE